MKQRDALERRATPASPCAGDRHVPASPSPASAAADPDLAAALATVVGAGAPSVLVAVANGAYADLVTAWASSVAATRTPALLFALDEEAAAAATAAGVAAFRVDLPIPDAQLREGGTGGSPPSNHAVSSLKYGLVGRVLALGYTCAVSDVDVLFLSNPFGEGGELGALQSDVAASSDGWDAASAYGWDDVHDEPGLGWARYAHSTRVMHLNSGLWAARPTAAAAAAVALVEARLAAEAGAWDQAVFNQVLLTPSHGGYASPSPSLRVLGVDAFVNSRVLWSRLGPAAVGAGSVPAAAAPDRPVAVHVNYHPEKLARLRAVASFYFDGNVRALEALPVWGGSESAGL